MPESKNQNVATSVVTRQADLDDAKAITAQANRTDDRTERTALYAQAAELRKPHGQ
ncbi:hypothetical protein AB0A95_30765 [Micromonospora sp. NPDC049230]|uniref:hypothetical protein n=1 Tax=Micromonospora sp. NPDC049230 TaxID=3155502 RepID=UPI0033C2FA42